VDKSGIRNLKIRDREAVVKLFLKLSNIFERRANGRHIKDVNEGSAGKDELSKMWRSG
jgi:hypothetical protein